MQATLPPGPRDWPWAGHLLQFRRDPLGFLTRCARQYGAVARIRLGPVPAYLVSRPDLIEDVLVTQHRFFTKPHRLRRGRRLTGNGLLFSEGEFWRRQRRLMQPAFHRERVAGYGQAMVRLTEQMLATWADGETRDIHAEMMRLTLAIAARTLFSAEVAGQAGAVEQALATLLARERARSNSLLNLPRRWPTPGNLRADRAARELDAIVYRI